MKNLSDDARAEVALFILENSTNGVPHHGKIKEAASKWGLTSRAISKIWSKARKQRAEGKNINVNSCRIGKKSRPKIVIDYDRIRGFSFKDRRTCFKLAKKFQVSNGTVGNWVKAKLLNPHTNALHPHLTPQNQMSRLNSTLQALFYDRLSNIFKFKSMNNVIHIDEKWFFLTQKSERYYCVPEETNEHRTCISKTHIPKVMFMCAVARPCFGVDNEVLFDGKIGIFPFIETVPAARSSRNRPAGTLVTKPIQSITKAVTKDCIINKIIPAIKAKWPASASKHIYIQQDNATPHFTGDDPDFVAAATADGWNIELVFQTPNSPDLNINDLGFFRAIQSLQWETSASNVEEMMNAVKIAFDTFDATKLNRIFLSLQACMVEIMKHKGNNDYKLPHMKKGLLSRQGMLPTDLVVDSQLVIDSIQHLLTLGEPCVNESLMQALDM